MNCRDTSLCSNLLSVDGPVKIKRPKNPWHSRDIARKNNWPVTHTQEERHDKSVQSGEQAQQSRSKLLCRPILEGETKEIEYRTSC